MSNDNCETTKSLNGFFGEDCQSPRSRIEIGENVSWMGTFIAERSFELMEGTVMKVDGSGSYCEISVTTKEFHSHVCCIPVEDIIAK